MTRRTDHAWLSATQQKTSIRQLLSRWSTPPRAMAVSKGNANTSWLPRRGGLNAENKKGGRLWMRLLWRAPGMPVCCWRSGELDSTTAKKPGWLGVLPPKETTWGSLAIYLWAAMAQRLTCRLTNHQWWKTQDVPASSCLFLEYPLGITGLFQMQAFCEILKR